MLCLSHEEFVRVLMSTVDVGVSGLGIPIQSKPQLIALWGLQLEGLTWMSPFFADFHQACATVPGLAVQDVVHLFGGPSGTSVFQSAAHAREYSALVRNSSSQRIVEVYRTCVYAVAGVVTLYLPCPVLTAEAAAPLDVTRGAFISTITNSPFSGFIVPNCHPFMDGRLTVLQNPDAISRQGRLYSNVFLTVLGLTTQLTCTNLYDGEGRVNLSVPPIGLKSIAEDTALMIASKDFQIVPPHDEPFYNIWRATGRTALFKSWIESRTHDLCGCKLSISVSLGIRGFSYPVARVVPRVTNFQFAEEVVPYLIAMWDFVNSPASDFCRFAITQGFGRWLGPRTPKAPKWELGDPTLPEYSEHYVGETTPLGCKLMTGVAKPKVGPQETFSPEPVPCRVCLQVIEMPSSASVRLHLASLSHQLAMEHYTLYCSKIRALTHKHCSTCGFDVLLVEWDDHCVSPAHAAAAGASHRRPSPSAPPSCDLDYDISEGAIHCLLCDVDVKIADGGWVDHLLGPTHQSRRDEVKMGSSLSSQRGLFDAVD